MTNPFASIEPVAASSCIKAPETGNLPIASLAPELKQQWVAALRSGKYQQGKDRLRAANTNSFCCLGVLCDLISPAGWELSKLEVPYASYTYRLPKSAPQVDDNQPRYSVLTGGLAKYTLPDNYLYANYIQSARVTIDGIERTLTEHNDSGATFEQIATAIEEQL